MQNAVSLKRRCFHFLLSWGAPWAVCVWQFADVEVAHGFPPGRTSSAPVPRSCPPWSGVEHVKIHVVKMTQGSLKSHMDFWPNWGRRVFSEGESPLQLSWAWGAGGAYGASLERDPTSVYRIWGVWPSYIGMLSNFCVSCNFFVYSL